MTSPAKIAACRANGQKSKGPKTAAGLERSSMNALKDGRRSSKIAMARENSFNFENRRHRWMAIDDPKNDQDEFLSYHNVVMSFELDRAVGAHLEHLTSLIENSDEIESEEVYELGKHLFFDPCGPTSLYGSAPDGCKQKTSWDKKALAPDKLVRKLETSAIGCQFLKEQWEALLAKLEEGKFWLSPDRLRATRLLGRQPVEAIDDQSVALIFVASHFLHRDGTRVFDDLLSDMKESKLDRFRKRVKVAWPEVFGNEEPGACRQLLVNLAQQNIERLNAKVEEHEENAEEETRRAFNRLGVDRSKEGTLLREHHQKCFHGLRRSMGELKKRLKDECGSTRAAAAERRRTRPGDDWKTAPDLAWAYELSAAADRAQQPADGTGAVKSGVPEGTERCSHDSRPLMECAIHSEGTARPNGAVIVDSDTPLETGGLVESPGLDSVGIGDEDGSADVGDADPADVAAADEGGSADESDADAVKDAAPGDCDGSPTAAVGGNSGTCAEQNVTNEPKLDETAIITECLDSVQVTADSRVEKGLDKGGSEGLEDSELAERRIGIPKSEATNPSSKIGSPSSLPAGYAVEELGKRERKGWQRVLVRKEVQGRVEEKLNSVETTLGGMIEEIEKSPGLEVLQRQLPRAP